MDTIFQLHEFAGIGLFLIIVFIVWVVSKYSPRLEQKIAELDVLESVRRLESDIENARDLHQLDRLENFIYVIHDHAKKTTNDPNKYSKRLLDKFHSRYWTLVNDYPGVPQQYLPYVHLL